MATLTVSGNEITDAVRSTATQGDGRASPDSSFGLWEATENLVTNGGFETNTTGWTDDGAVGTRDTSTFKFGVGCLKLVSSGTSIAEGAFTGWAGLTIGDVYTASVWLKGASGVVAIRLASGATVADSSLVTLDGTWQRITATITLSSGSLNFYIWTRPSGAAQAITWYADGAQVEKQPIATPYVETDGTTAARSAARVQKPASLIDETQAWVAARIRAGWVNTADPSGNPTLFQWKDDANNLIEVRYDTTANQWELQRRNDAGTGEATVADTFAADDEITVIAAWTATDLQLTVSTTFTSVAAANIPTLAATLFDIGSSAGTAEHLDSDIFWFHCNTGTLTDADAVTINGFGNTDHPPEDFPGSPTAVAYFDTSYYEDETFTKLGALPSVRVDVDFANNPTSSTRTWVDITSSVRQFAVTRGRKDALSRPEVGALSLTLQNQDGHFDPTNTAGDYYPNVLPMRRIRVRARWNLVNYNLFHGHIEDWPLSFPDNKNALVEVRAVDALAVLNPFDLTGKNYAAQRSDIRGSAVLVDCGFGTAEMNLRTGRSTMVASGTIADGNSAQAMVLDISASENGLFFVDAGGTWVFQDRHFRQTQKSSASGTVGTQGGQIGYQDIRTSYGAMELANIVKVTASGGTAETTTDASSTASYYQRTLTWPVSGTYLVSSQAEALSAAQYIKAVYSTPALRVPEVVAVPAGATANWPTVLAAELSDRLAVAHVRPDGGTITGDKHLEGLGHAVTFEREWTVALALSDADAQAFWILGNANLSLLGNSTTLGY